MKINIVLILGIVALATAEWNELMEGGYFEGDMEMSPGEVSQLKNAFGSITTRKWPKSGRHVTIRYKIDAGVAGARNVINQAIQDYEANTCLRFTEDNSANINRQPHIKFIFGSGCSSPVGRQTSTDRNRRYYGNSIKLHNSRTGTCWRKGTVMHEMAHTIGFYHEQSRPDRGQFVDIHLNNVQPVNGRDMTHNFDINNNINSLGHRYDYLSMMHYGATAFGKGRRTITTLDRSYQNRIGQRGGFSQGDIAQINRLYQC